MPRMSKAERKKHCAGCYCNYYNGTGANECWSLDTAKLVMKKEVHVDQRPPWDQKPIKVLSCYHRQRYVYVDPQKTC